MFSVLADRTYRHLFLAHIVALLGTGLATIALGLLAYDLANERAGQVLGTVFTIKMVAYVGIAPIAGAFANRWPRRALLVSLDLIRAVVAICLPFVSEVWQVYVLIFVLQSASASFTPTFQATIPDILPEEERYTCALSLSRLAYDLENIISPMLAAILLAFVSYHMLFVGTVIGFAGSALLVVSVMLPSSKPTAPRGIYDRTTRGLRIYLATPRLRGLLSLNLAAAAAGAMVLVNTVVLVRSDLGFGDSHVAMALGRIRWWFHACRARPSQTSGQPARPIGDDWRSRRACCHAFWPCKHVTTQRPELVSALGRVDHCRRRIFDCADSVRSTAERFCTSRGQASRLRGPIRLVTCLLAFDLSACGMDDHHVWSDIRTALVGLPRHNRAFWWNDPVDTRRCRTPRTPP